MQVQQEQRELKQQAPTLAEQTWVLRLVQLEVPWKVHRTRNSRRGEQLEAGPLMQVQQEQREPIQQAPTLAEQTWVLRLVQLEVPWQVHQTRTSRRGAQLEV